DAGGSDITEVSVTKPFFGPKGEMLGVAGADISLEQMRISASYLRLRSVESQDGDYAFLVSKRGRIIAHPDQKLMLRKDYPGAEASALPDGQLAARQAKGL